jgi:hypothetical protein
MSFNYLQSKSKTVRTLASSNVSRSVFSDSPDIPDTIDGAETEMNGTPNSCSTKTEQKKNQKAHFLSVRIPHGKERKKKE